MKRFICLILLSICFFVASAQTPPTANSADIYLAIKKLNVLGSVLYIAAHPDDENTRLLAYLAKEKKYRTGYLSLTRGDGGQNLIGNEQGIEMGLIRTQELLAARRIDGAEQFFSSAYDFGFSKTADETLKIWDKQKVLADIVWVIRKFKPDVIITRFPGDARAGHGHHAASSLLANEAFKISGDPNMFKEQLKEGVEPWQAKRILWNTFSFGGNNTTAADQFRIEVGMYNPLLGKGYGEIASESRSQHKSQGFGVARQRGISYEYFTTTGGEAPKNDLLDGVNTSWERESNKQLLAIETAVNNVLAKYDFLQPEKSVKPLVEIYKQLNMLGGTYWVTKKMEEVQTIIERSAGLFTEAFTPNKFMLSKDSITVTCFLNKRKDINANLLRLLVCDNDTTVKQDLITNTNYSFRFKFPTGISFKDNQPYWLRNEKTEGNFSIPNQQQVGKPENDPVLAVHFSVMIEGQAFKIVRPVMYKYTDPIKGEIYQPVAIKPFMNVAISPNVALTNVDSERKEKTEKLIRVYVEPFFTASNIPLTVYVLQEKVKPFFENKLHNLEAGKGFYIDIPVEKYYSAKAGNRIKIAVKAKIKGVEYMFEDYQTTIAYDHIPDITYQFPDHIKLVSNQISTKGKKIGYINGAGDRVLDAIRQLEYDAVVLNESDITIENLKQFDAIVTGVRAYNTNEYLSNKFDVLMKFVEEGGNLIVQYNTSSQIGPVKAKISPYPFTIGRTRVTEENAKVNFLLPNHPVLNFPNKITEKDFDDWVQERSIYQAENMAPNFEAPLGMNDLAEGQTNGSLAIAKYGKGNFVYTGLVFFRQLPAGNPGAYRLFANILSLPKNN